MDNTHTRNLTFEVVWQSKQSAQVWSNIVDICGGLIALHKCNWQLITWHQSQGYMTLVQDSGTTLTLGNTHGTPTEIGFLPPHKPNVGLGYMICLDGNQTPQFRSLLQDIRTICVKISYSFLTEAETRQALHQRLIPKIQYVLHLTTFSSKQCSGFNSIIWKTFLPRLRLNRHFLIQSYMDHLVMAAWPSQRYIRFNFWHSWNIWQNSSAGTIQWQTTILLPSTLPNCMRE